MRRITILFTCLCIGLAFGSLSVASAERRLDQGTKWMSTGSRNDDKYMIMIQGVAGVFDDTAVVNSAIINYSEEYLSAGQVESASLAGQRVPFSMEHAVEVSGLADLSDYSTRTILRAKEYTLGANVCYPLNDKQHLVAGPKGAVLKRTEGKKLILVSGSGYLVTEGASRESSASAKVAASLPPVRVEVNGKPLICSAPPVQTGGRTLVPLRDIFEALGAQVEWDGSARKITARKDSTLVQLIVGDRSATVDGQSVELDVPATITRGVTMVPLRFVGEAFGAEVKWDATTRTVVITTHLSQEVRTQIERLNSTSDRVRADAAKELGKMGPKAAPAVPFLIDLLHDYSFGQLPEDTPGMLVGLPYLSPTSPSIKAAEALVEIGPSSVQPLIVALQDPDTIVRQHVVDALGKLGDARAVEPLISALGDHNYFTRCMASDALVNVGSASVEPLIASLNNADEEVRTLSAASLGDIGDARAVEPLIALLNDSYWNARTCATCALGKIRDARAIEPILALLSDPDWVVRGCAAEQVGKIGGAKVVEPLIHALNDSSESVQKDAVDALRDITGQDFGMDQSKWQEWWAEAKTSLDSNKEDPSIADTVP